jgi:eukaryotic-like serine/threonine-protein kinase
MAISTGKRFGPYEVVSPLGQGGMGEVYRARDTRLDRTVAIKVLPTILGDRVDLRKRLQREARALSSLSHPHICALYDIGEQDGAAYLVMEYLEGETLASRLEKGPLPPDQVLKFGIQIADALEKAHAQGITHRDRKPGNIMLTKNGAKLLDFGLALLNVQAVPGNPVLADLVTIDRKLTEEGVILGTFQYMAPEQLEGKNSDARSDIFALGAVLYEMSAGRPAFRANTKASLIAAILSSEPPPISTLQPLMPRALDRLVNSCLRKEPDERLQTAHDVKLQLQWIREGVSELGVALPIPARQKTRELIAWLLAGLVLLSLVGLVVVRGVYPSYRPAPPIRFDIPATTERYYSAEMMQISPDGTRVAFPARSTSDEKRRLWVRSLTTGEVQELQGTEGADWPLWSPDGRSIAFGAEGKLKRIDATGGAVTVLCDGVVPGGWTRDGTIILLTSYSGPLYRVPEQGGVPVPVTQLEASRKEIAHYWCQILPDGHHFLFMARRGDGPDEGEVYIGDLYSQSRKLVLSVKARTYYVEPGYLLYIRGGALLAQPFDLAHLRVKGEGVRIADQAAFDTQFGWNGLSVSQAGVILYERVSGLAQLTWFDRSGKEVGTISKPAQQGSPRLSPSDSEVLVERFEKTPQNATFGLWTYDLQHDGLESRITPDLKTEGHGGGATPAWSPSGDRVAYTSLRQGKYGVFTLSRQSGKEELIATSPERKYVSDWSPDGRYLVVQFAQDEPKRVRDIYSIDLRGERRLMPFIQTDQTEEAGGRISPDGHWLAYSSDETGQLEVYVQRFPDGGAKKRVSSSGGVQPIWRHDGKELFFVGQNFYLTALPVHLGTKLEYGQPKPLFRIRPADVLGTDYDVSKDGQRFLVNTAPKASGAGVTGLVNWPSLLTIQ